MLTYKLYPYKNSATGVEGYIARAVVTETYSLDKLAEHMNKHNTPFSKGTIKGILSDMVSCIIELALEGKAVKIPDLGIFTIGLQSKVVKKIEDWNQKTGIAGVKLNCRATGDARPILLDAQAELKEADDYASPKPKTNDDGTTDGGTTTGDDSGSDSGSSSDSGNTGGTSYDVIDDGDGSDTGSDTGSDSGSSNP